MKLGIVTLALAALGLPLVASAGPTLYSVQSNNNDHLYSIDAATGVATDLGLLAFGDAEGLAFIGSSLFAIGGSVGELWNITTPPGSLVGATGPRSGVDAGLDYNSANGLLYNYNATGGGGSLYVIDPITGLATLVGSSSVFLDGLAINSAGQAFGIDGIFSDSLYSVDLATGATALIGGLGIGDISVQFGLTDADGTLYGLNSNGSLYSFNTLTGAATFLASTTCDGQACGAWEGLAALQGTAVPEPGSLALVGLGLAAAVGTRRRKQVADHC